MLPCVFTVIASLAPSYLSLRRKRFWVDDWDDGVNFSNNPLLFGAFAAGTERNSTALAGILRETWRPRVVLGVWEPVADTAKVAYASALGFSNIIHDEGYNEEVITVQREAHGILNLWNPMECQNDPLARCF